MRTKAGYKIARKAGIKYSRLPIRVLTTLLEDLIYKLESKLSRETQTLSLQDSVKQSAETTSEKIFEVHTRKLNQERKKKPNSTKVDKEKWVVHIPQRTLNPVEIAVLEKGFKFRNRSKENSSRKDIIIG